MERDFTETMRTQKVHEYKIDIHCTCSIKAVAKEGGCIEFWNRKKKICCDYEYEFFATVSVLPFKNCFPKLLKSLSFRELSTIDHLTRPALDPREAKLGSPDQSLQFRANRQLQFLDTAMDEVVREPSLFHILLNDVLRILITVLNSTCVIQNNKMYRWQQNTSMKRHVQEKYVKPGRGTQGRTSLYAKKRRCIHIKNKQKRPSSF